MDHDHGNPQPARPIRHGTGIGKGNRAESWGSHRCSCSIRAAETARRGTRTTRSSPNRNSLLSHPSPISFNDRCARSVCCSWISARTNAGSIATSAGGFGPITKRSSYDRRETTTPGSKGHLEPGVHLGAVERSGLTGSCPGRRFAGRPARTELPGGIAAAGRSTSPAARSGSGGADCGSKQS